MKCVARAVQTAGCEHHLGRARVPYEHHGLAQLEQHARDRLEARRVQRRNEDTFKRTRAVVSVRRYHLAPVAYAAARLDCLGASSTRRHHRAAGGDKVVEDGALLGPFDCRPLAELGAPVGVKARAEVGSLIGAVRASQGPDGCELEVGLVHLLVCAGWAVLGGEERLEQGAHQLNARELREGRRVPPALLASVLERGGDKRVKETLE